MLGEFGYNAIHAQDSRHRSHQDSPFNARAAKGQFAFYRQRSNLKKKNRNFKHLLYIIFENLMQSGTEMELMESQPLLEWLANNYKTFGATLEIITDKSQEGSQFVRGFGGIGGLFQFYITNSTNFLFNFIFTN